MTTITETGQITNIVDGAAVSSRGDHTLNVINPADETVLGSFTESSAQDVDDAVRSAKQAFPAWAAKTPGERADLIRQLADLATAHIEELARLEVLDAGKPWTASRHTELPGMIDSLRHFGALARMAVGPLAGEYTAGNTAYVRREPLGVAAAITPWNFPLWQAIWKIGPALAVGNTVVVKPAENTPLSTLRFVELASTLLPPGVVNLVQGRGATTGHALVTHPDINIVSFTGSTAAGRTIAQAAGQGPKRLVLELGGNAPILVFDDADIDAATTNIASTMLFNAGQECMAATRLLVHNKVRDQFVDTLRQKIRANTVIGDTLDPDTTLGPLISSVQRDRVQGLIERRQRGSEIVLGGDAPDRKGYYFNPTLIIGVQQFDEIVQSEIFGPVATVQTFDEESEAVQLANDVDQGLAGSVWTRDVGRGLRAVNALEFGTVWLNNHMVGCPEIPIGGFRGSGYGKEGGLAGLDEFARLKQVVISLT